MAHGAGESLKLHLSQIPPPNYLIGLTSQASETEAARRLVDSIPHPNTSVELITGSASYRPGKDLDHPLNPMRGYLGQQSPITHEDTDDEDIHDEAQQVFSSPDGPPPYDLVYVLDAVYHFRPAVPYFLASVFQVLRPDQGVIAFTDILPPPSVNAFLGHLVLPPLLSIPARNIMNRPKSFDEYVDILERIGYSSIRIEDWSEGVWKGFSANLKERGLFWRLVGRAVDAAERNGWKFIAVRAKRPAAAVDTA